MMRSPGLRVKLAVARFTQPGVASKVRKLVSAATVPEQGTGTPGPAGRLTGAWSRPSVLSAYVKVISSVGETAAELELISLRMAMLGPKAVPKVMAGRKGCGKVRAVGPGRWME